MRWLLVVLLWLSALVVVWTDGGCPILILL